MKILKIIFLLLFVTTISYCMEEPNSIAACVDRAKTIEQVYEDAPEFLKKIQPDIRKITTERFLLDCQQKFNRSMYEIGLTLATSESLEISENLREEAEYLWNEKTKQRNYAEYLFGNFRQDIDQHRIPSFLYYIYLRSGHAQEAPHPYYKEAMVAATLDYGTPQISSHARLELWIKSGILQNKTHLSHLFQNIIQYSRSTASLSALRLLIDAGYDTNVTISGHHFSEGIIMRTAPKEYLPMTILDFSMELHRTWEALSGYERKEMIILLTQIIRMLIRAGAKSTYEL
jgi:hypothetical protein